MEAVTFIEVINLFCILLSLLTILLDMMVSVDNPDNGFTENTAKGPYIDILPNSECTFLRNRVSAAFRCSYELDQNQHAA